MKFMPSDVELVRFSHHWVMVGCERSEVAVKCVLLSCVKSITRQSQIYRANTRCSSAPGICCPGTFEGWAVVFVQGTGSGADCDLLTNIFF